MFLLSLDRTKPIKTGEYYALSWFGDILPVWFEGTEKEQSEAVFNFRGFSSAYELYGYQVINPNELCGLR